MKSLFSVESFLQAACGALGSFVSMTLLHPFEISRTRLQVDPKLVPRSSIPLIISISKKEGLSALYQGWASLMLALSTTNFVYFFTFHWLRSIQDINSGIANDFLCAATAGVLTVLVTNPLWVVNIRFKLAKNKSQKGENKQKQNYTSIVNCLTEIIRLEGFKTLWSGTSSSLLLVTNPTIQFAAYEALKRSTWFSIFFGENHHICHLLNGALAKFLATVATYPLQVVQTQRRAGVLTNDSNGNILRQIVYMIQKDGIYVLFSGLEAKLTQTCLNAAVLFLAYEELANKVFTLVGVER
jgi:adenine nucleotide transporter 17